MDASTELRNLLGTYCDLMDAGDWPAVGQLFARAVLADEHGTEIARGADAVAELYRAGTRLHDGSPRTKHLVTNTVIEIDGGTAVVRSSYLVLQATATMALQPIITGRYVDRFEQEPGEWHFTERRFAIDLVGDLSQHLRYRV